MKREKRLLAIAGAVLIMGALIFAIVFIAAIVKAVMGDALGAGLCLLWGISIDMLATAILNSVEQKIKRGN